MERLPQSRARLIVNVMNHGTVVGTEDAVRLEFEDCVNAVQGLASYLGELLSEVNAEDGYEITSAILIDALHHWTFDESWTTLPKTRDQTTHSTTMPLRRAPAQLTAATAVSRILLLASRKPPAGSVDAEAW